MKLEEFLENNRISSDDWKNANIDFEELLKIEADYKNQMAHLNESAEFLGKVLQKCPQVHSVRWRVKDPMHVLEKIIRKRASGSEKYKGISVKNYSEIITDLVGVRVLHLFKNEWLDIHEYIKRCWNPVEGVVAYIREGDEGGVVDSYKENDCAVQVHSAGYRSIHYIISTQPTLVKVFSEIQVRTIFEEGWSEIDHKVRYPNFLENKLVSYFLTIFNRMAGSADEMGTFVNDLVADIKWKELQLELKQNEQEEHLKKIEALAKDLSSERSAGKSKDVSLSNLQKEITSLRKNSIQMPTITLSNPDLLDIGKWTSLSREALKVADLGRLNDAQMHAIKLSDVNKFSSAYEDLLKNTKLSNTLKTIKNISNDALIKNIKIKDPEDD